MKMKIVLGLLLIAGYPQKTFKEQLDPSVTLPPPNDPAFRVTAFGAALIVRLYCSDPKVGLWEPCKDAKQLNPDKSGNLTVIFKGVLDDGTEFRIAPVGEQYR